MRVGEAFHLITCIASSSVGIGAGVSLAAPFAVWAAVGRPGGGRGRGAITIGAR